MVIRPEKPMEVDRIETDNKETDRIYMKEGYACEQKKCYERKTNTYKNKLLAKRMFFIHGDIGGMGDHSCYMG